MLQPRGSVSVCASQSEESLLVRPVLCEMRSFGVAVSQFDGVSVFFRPALFSSQVLLYFYTDDFQGSSFKPVFVCDLLSFGKCYAEFGISASPPSVSCLASSWDFVSSQGCSTGQFQGHRWEHSFFGGVKSVLCWLSSLVLTVCTGVGYTEHQGGFNASRGAMLCYLTKNKWL